MSFTVKIRFRGETKLRFVNTSMSINMHNTVPRPNVLYSLCYINYISDENTIEAINQCKNEGKEIRDQNSN